MQILAFLIFGAILAGNILATMAFVGSLLPSQRNPRYLNWANQSIMVGTMLVLLQTVFSISAWDFAEFWIFILTCWLPLFLGYIARIRLRHHQQ